MPWAARRRNGGCDGGLNDRWLLKRNGIPHTGLPPRQDRRVSRSTPGSSPTLGSGWAVPWGPGTTCWDDGSIPPAAPVLHQQAPADVRVTDDSHDLFPSDHRKLFYPMGSHDGSCLKHLFIGGHRDHMCGHDLANGHTRNAGDGRLRKPSLRAGGAQEEKASAAPSLRK